jgi:hypothetical protein
MQRLYGETPRITSSVEFQMQSAPDEESGVTELVTIGSKSYKRGDVK